MNYCTSSVRVTWPRLYCMTVFTNPNRRHISNLFYGPARISPIIRRPRNVSFSSQYFWNDLENQQQQQEHDTKPTANIPNRKEYPLLPSSIFHDPCHPKSWESLSRYGVFEGKSRVATYCHTKLWKHSLTWKTKSGEKYAVNSSARLKKQACKTASLNLLVKLHLEGVLANISKTIEEENPTLPSVSDKSCTNVRQSAFNYAASICAIPQVNVINVPSKRQKRHYDSYTVSVKIDELDIAAEASGKIFSHVEFEAYSNFMKAVEEHQKTKSDFDASQQETRLVLDVSRGKEFVYYYARRSSKAHAISILTENTRGLKDEMGRSLNVSKVLMDGEMIGTAVYTRKAKDSAELAYLTAAIDLAKRNPQKLSLFLKEKRGSSGEIVQPTIQVPFDVSHNILANSIDISSPVLRARIGDQRYAKSTAYLEDTRPQRSFRSGLSVSEARDRNNLLKSQYEAYHLNPYFRDLRKQKAGLPISQYRSEVLDLVNKNCYSIIVGETGSGKTTQVPAIILEDAIARGEATSVNIVCTQPRRIAAKAVANRVAFERGEKLQETVGYHVYLDVKRPREGGSITYCTTEIFLKQLQNAPDHVMESVSHIVIDEAHERDVPIDFLFITLKKIIHARQAIGKTVPRVVIMSATLNLSLFAGYFGQIGADGVNKPCPSLSVPGKTFPVRKKYLDEILSELTESYKNSLRLGMCTDTRKYLQIEDSFCNPPESELIGDRAREIVGNSKDLDESLIPIGLISTTIAHIIRSTSEGAILTFLPGLKDLEEAQKSLLGNPLGVNFSDVSKYQIILLHSLMKDNQNILFEPSPPGCRKIILATNIAETSITITDVQHVVDSGKLNEMHYDPITRIKNLRCIWASKSNSRQRCGRAGRVQNGNYYALFSENRFESLREYGLPQILRSDLQDVCLSTKGQAMKYPIKEFLADAIEKPSSEAVDVAIKDLVDLGALTVDEQITPLGRLLHSLPLDPDLGKMIVLGVIFRCFDPLLTLACASAERDFFVRPPTLRKESDRARRSFGGNSGSDAIALINAFRLARESRRRMGSREYIAVMVKNFLSVPTFDIIQKRMYQIEQVLIESGLIPRASKGYSSSLMCGHDSLNENSNNINLIKALTLARCPTNIAVRLGGTFRFRTKTETALRIRSGINGLGFGQAINMPKCAIVSYAGLFKDDNSLLCLKETNIISPLAAALFGGPLEARSRRLSVDDWITLNLYTDSTMPYPSKVIADLRVAMGKILSQSFFDLARRRNLLDDPLRRDFTAAVAELLTLTAEEHIVESDDSSNTSDQKQRGYISLYPFVNDLLTEIKRR